MRFGSVCSGIEAASVAWHPLGWRAAFVSEIEKFPCAVLAHHYPDVPNYGDMTRYQEWPDAAIDVLVGGTPCQSFSVAGLRKGLDDPRGNLMLTYGAVARRYRPRWLVWENVPGVLSSNQGRDFGTFLGMLAELGYGFAYRILDAQYIRVDSHARAVPQRRRRVFVVGHLGDWRRAAAVLFEREGLQGHPAPRREAGQTAPTIPSRSTAGGGLGTDFDCDGGLVADIAHALTARTARTAKGGDPTTDTLVPSVAGPVMSTYGKTLSRAGKECGRIDNHVISIQERAICENPNAGPDGVGIRTDGAAYTLESRIVPQAVATHMAVRRLTPRECERLQGFEDDYTLIPYRNKPAADGPRYKSLGNAMAIPPMSWIGQRIQLMEEISSAALGDGDTAA